MYQTIPQEQLNLIKEILTERVPELANIMRKVPSKVFLAGGAIRTLISTDEEFDAEKTDIDLFFFSPDELNIVKEFLENKTNYHKVFQCPEGKLASYVFLNGEEPKWKIQCISVSYYDDLKEVIDSFDFTCTQFGTDWEVGLMGETSEKDVMNKHLVFHKVTYPSSTLRRMMKYSRKGYHMEENDFQHFVSILWNRDPQITDEKLVYVD